MNGYHECCYQCGVNAREARNPGGPWNSIPRVMHVCPTCGNKRCPKATWHENDCTNSNDVYQPGSRYGGMDA